MTATETHRTIDAIWRIESPKLIAGLARMVRDVGVAEDLAQDALVAALEQWPQTRVPNNPGAWLMATAKHRAIDYFRRNTLLERKHAELGYEIESDRSKLFDLAKDPDEKQNVDYCYPARSRDYRRHLRGWIAAQNHAVLSEAAWATGHRHGTASFANHFPHGANERPLADEQPAARDR